MQASRMKACLLFWSVSFGVQDSVPVLGESWAVSGPLLRRQVAVRGVPAMEITLGV
jgi:hypothetical protein